MQPPAARSFDIVEVVASARFPPGHAVHMRSADLTLEYARESGLRNPLLFTESNSLGLSIPPPTFSVYDVM